MQERARTKGLGLRGSRIGEQAIEFRFDYLVALAGPFLQSSPVKHSDVATVVTNNPSVLQFPGSLRDALATHAQHIGDQFLRHGQFIRGRSVET
jgi:hypothetical protein